MHGDTIGREKDADSPETRLDDDASYTLFQRSFWKRLYVLAAPFWFRPLKKGDSSRTAIGLLALLLLLIFVTTWLLVKVAFIRFSRSPVASLAVPRTRTPPHIRT